MLKPKPIHKNSLNEVKAPASKKNLFLKKHHKLALEMGSDVIDVAISSFLRSDRSKGKENLLPSEVLEKAK